MEDSLHLLSAAGGISWTVRGADALQRVWSATEETLCSSASQPSFHGKTMGTLTTEVRSPYVTQGLYESALKLLN